MKKKYSIFTVWALISFSCYWPVLCQSEDKERLEPVFSTTDDSGAGMEKEMNLEEVIETALANNPEIAAKEWDVKASQAKAEQVYGKRFPRIGMVGGYSHSLKPQRLFGSVMSGDSAIFSRDIVTSDLTFSLPLFTAGRLTDELKAAQLLKDASAYRLARNRRELEFNITSVFFGILVQKRVIRSLEFSYQALEEHLNRIDELVKAEKAARVDRMRVEVRLANIRQEKVRAENLMVVQCRVLASLAGLENPSENIYPRGNLEEATISPLPDLEDALSTARNNRKDYLAAKAEKAAQVSNLEAAASERYPMFSVKGTYGGRWALGAINGSGDREGDVGQIAMVMEIPIFEGGSLSGRIREMRFRVAAAGERLRALDYELRLEVETALLNVESQRERAKAIHKSIEQARENLSIEKQKYELGSGAVVDVLDAQADLLEIETTYSRVLAELQTSLAQLRLATGE